MVLSTKDEAIICKIFECIFMDDFFVIVGIFPFGKLMTRLLGQRS